jgi:choline dehydrogenase-like flavoprotein
MKQAIVVGSGAGGALAARELQGRYSVMILEAGKESHPFRLNLSVLEKIKKTGLLFNEYQIHTFFPSMRIRRTREHMILVNGNGLGGTTFLSTANALRMDHHLKKLGINLDAEFEELYKEIPVTTGHRNHWNKTTRYLFDICREMNLDPHPMPKMGDYNLCASCGHCVLGCPHGAKWDSRHFVNLAVKNGAMLKTGTTVEKVIIENGIATGVKAGNGTHKIFYPADLIILSAGGFATPVILENSGITCEKRLFVDPVLCVAAEWKGCFQNREISMPFYVKGENFIISPYFDYLSFFFNKSWKYPASDILSLMIKFADSNSGYVAKNKVDKLITEQDRERIKNGTETCISIMKRLGINENRIFYGTINAGHPGGMLPLTVAESETFHNPRLPDNLYVADATLFPESLGNPPIFTIMAMAKRISKICITS